MNIDYNTILDEYGYKYDLNHDGISFLKSTNIPDKLNTEYILFERITIYGQEVCFELYKTDALLNELERNTFFVRRNVIAYLGLYLSLLNIKSRC